MEPRKVRQLLSPTETQVTRRSSDGNTENENIFEVAWQTLRLSCHAIIDPHIHIPFVLLYFTVLTQFCCNHSLNTDFLSLFSPTDTSKTMLWQDQNREEPFLRICYVCSAGALRGLCAWRGFLIKDLRLLSPQMLGGHLIWPCILYRLLSRHKHTTHNNTQLCMSYQKLSVWCWKHTSAPPAPSTRKRALWQQRFFTMQILLCPLIWNLPNMPVMSGFPAGAGLGAALPMPWSGSTILQLLTPS